ncbi:triacylglycerol lipase [Biscogniauxia mediterranea]|nr:triacylglycerol lipase [Biscogniauxia mediterranea]
MGQVYRYASCYFRRPHPGLVHRCYYSTPRGLTPLSSLKLGCVRHHSSHRDGDPRLKDLGREIHDDYASLRNNYATPKHPIVLAHGLLGFAELQVPGGWLPAIHYWRGISDALAANGVQVIRAAVPPSSRIEQRAEKLAQDIGAEAEGREVSIVAHSMGGLDARYMISRLRPRNVKVRSLVTIASPHRGCSFADYLLDQIGAENVPKVLKFVEGAGIDTGAFSQLTRKYMTETFNPETPDDPDYVTLADPILYYSICPSLLDCGIVRMPSCLTGECRKTLTLHTDFSYGAMMDPPSLLNPFRQSYRVVSEAEGPNDGLVSVESSKWGSYKGTLVNVSHLDLINWTNRLKWMFSSFAGQGPKFNAIAFYLDIADMLAKEDL